MIDYESVMTSKIHSQKTLVHLPISPVGFDDKTDIFGVSRTEIEQRTNQIHSGWSLQERERRRQLGQRAVARLAALIIRPINY